MFPEGHVYVYRTLIIRLKMWQMCFWNKSRLDLLTQCIKCISLTEERGWLSPLACRNASIGELLENKVNKNRHGSLGLKVWLKMCQFLIIAMKSQQYSIKIPVYQDWFLYHWRQTTKLFIISKPLQGRDRVFLATRQYASSQIHRKLGFQHQLSFLTFKSIWYTPMDKLQKLQRKCTDTEGNPCFFFTWSHAVKLLKQFLPLTPTPVYDILILNVVFYLGPLYLTLDLDKMFV